MRRAELLLKLLACIVLGVMTGCGSLKKKSMRDPLLKIRKTNFEDLPGWTRDQGISEALVAFRKSCRVLLKKKKKENVGLGTTCGDWHAVCEKAQNAKNFYEASVVRSFFEKYFTPYLVTDRGNPEGLFTGYYESSLDGSLEPTHRFKYPLYKKPAELVLSQGKEKKWGVLKWGRIVPYYTRAEIDKGALKGMGLELVWVDDPVEAFFLHTQGSGRVTLPHGHVMRVNYAASNGHPFVSIGRELINDNIMDTKDVSVQSIRRWMARNPRKAEKLMHKNPSYVFFRRVPVQSDEGPIGCMGIPVTPGRSLAIDRRYLPLGAPLWFDGDRPGNFINERRLMVAQDTGGAIRGVVRGDFFWGFGQEALEKAGRMRSKGQYYILLPKSVSVPRSFLLKNL